MGDISQHIRNWENCLIGKERSKMSQEQRINFLLNRLRPRRFCDHRPIEGWQICYATFDGFDDKGARRYSWLPHKLEMVDSSKDGTGRYRTIAKPEWSPIGLDEPWGDMYVNAFLKTSFKVPREWEGKPMYMLFFVGGDGMLKVNGKDRQGADCFHTEIWLADLAKAGATLKFDVETYQKHEVDVERFHDLMVSTMALRDEEVEELYWDLHAALSAAKEDFALPQVRQHILHHLDEAFKILDVFEPDVEAFRKTAREARKYVRANILSSEDFQNSGVVCAIGHSHLDIVYKWSYDEFLRKIGRTHTTQLRLMQEFPEFKFSQSQAITYLEMKRLYPDTFKQVQEAVKAGQWEILGACFSESDCNIPGGESHIRNIMLGKRFFQKEFNFTPRISWQCDLFGVIWTLPQILKKCGVDYFVTHKMYTWNTDNPWPYNIYWWEGPDGSRVLTHTPSSHIIQTCEGSQVQSHWENFGEKLQCGQSLYTFGWGDGGSGVMRDMLFRAGGHQKFPGMPKVKFDHAEDFFARVSKRVKDRTDMPVWSNELYLETHRGSLTTQGNLKKLNRRMEVLLRNAELLRTLAWRLTGLEYCNEAFNAAWIELFKAQFHDGVTGTHTAAGHKDVLAFFAKANAIAQTQLDQAVDAISGKIDTAGQGQAMVLFNTQTWERSEPVRLPGDKPARVVDQDGVECLTQVVQRNGQKEVWFQAPAVPPCGYRVLRVLDGKPASPASDLKVSASRLENDKVVVKLDKDGHVVSFYDKANRREVIEKGKLGNEFQLFEDIAGYYEAWDLHNTKDVHRWDCRKAESVKVVEEGPLRVAVEVVRKIDNSVLTQRIVLWKDATWLDFETHVDWKNETHRVLKVAFPLNVWTGNCRYDLAYGNMDRPTTRSTTWEQTKFEVVGHKWADLSDAGYGAALVNDCKYGYDCEKNVLRLTLLRAPKYPNPGSDLYQHTFTYRLFAHKGDWRRGGTIRNAWSLNAPLLPYLTASHGGELPAEHSFLTCPNENIVLEAVKKAEDSDDVIFRFVEHWGQQDYVQLSLPGAQSYREANCVEEDLSAARKVKGGELEFAAKPFEIVSLKMQM